MKKLVLSLLVLSLLGLGGQAFAELCTIDQVPAATLLLPYFEVDLDNDAGVTTLFSVNNASAAPQLVHAVMWTDWSYPTIDFDFYLTGYDVVTVNLRDVFDGNLPVTAVPDADPLDTVSPHAGDYSDNPHWDDTYLVDGGDYDPNFPGPGGPLAPFFPNCATIMPFDNPVLSTCLQERINDGHTGQPVTCGTEQGCFGFDHGDNIARGYITFDNANLCSLIFPNDDQIAYFDATGDGAVANFRNVLWGDFFIVDPQNAFAHGDTLVHIEADPSLQDANVGPNDSTNYTFYGRYASALNGEDSREPLGTTWAARYLNGGPFSGGTDYVVWRDSTEGDGWDLTCGATPPWFPLNETEIIAFNEAEDAVQICVPGVNIPPVSPPPPDEDDQTCFPLETGRYAFGEGVLEVPFDFGWTFFNLNHSYAGDDVTPAEPYAQSFVSAIHSASGLYSTGLNAIELSSACDAVDPSIQFNPGPLPDNDIPVFP